MLTTREGNRTGVTSSARDRKSVYWPWGVSVAFYFGAGAVRAFTFTHD